MTLTNLCLSGESLVVDGTGPDLTIQGLQAGNGIILSSDGNCVTIDQTIPTTFGEISFDLLNQYGFSGPAPPSISGNYVLFGGKHAILNLELTHYVEFYDDSKVEPMTPGTRGGFEFQIRFDTASVPAFRTGVKEGGGPVTVRNLEFGGSPLSYKNDMMNTMGAAAGASKSLSDIRVTGTMVGSRMRVVPSMNTPVSKHMRIFMSLQVCLF